VALVGLSSRNADSSSGSLHSLSRQLRRREREMKRMSGLLEQSTKQQARAQGCERN
jgi:hypothetical protein